MANQFIQADSRNLPEVNSALILEYFQTSDKHNVAEIRGVKTLMASRDGYIQTAVGYVELKREGNICTIKAKVVPEHKITKRYYQVTVQINEGENVVIDTTCDGCPASAGGCKHSIVVLFWLEKKTSEPSTTSTECYWKRPRLASEGTQPKTTKEIGKKNNSEGLQSRDPEKLNLFYAECTKRGSKKSLLTSFMPGQFNEGHTKYCVFDLMLEFISKTSDHSFENFKMMMASCLTKNIIEEIEQSTKAQANSKLWHSIRQGRITGSKIHEVCHCTTPDGSLVEQILGGYKMYETKAMKRGKTLEKPVLREMEKILKCEIKSCGITLINLICGASPDGITNEFVVEIKCPSNKDTIKKYVKADTVKEKFLAQCQFQMLATGCKKCAFCVADPDFEKNKRIKIVWVEFDQTYANKLLSQAELFWKNCVYPKMLDSVKS